MTQSALSGPTRRERQRADTRERIYEAALAEIRSVGFAESQIPRIAKAAGVVRGTFYFHFPSKQHVLLELVARKQRQVVEALHALRGRTRSLREVLARLIEAIADVDASLGQRSLLREVVAMYVRSGEEHEPTEGERGLQEELAHHFAEAMARGELREDVAPDRLAAAVLTSIFGLLLTRAHDDPDQRAELELLMDLLLEGMGRAPAR